VIQISDMLRRVEQASRWASSSSFVVWWQAVTAVSSKLYIYD
jgi:hypothetical protein